MENPLGKEGPPRRPPARVWPSQTLPSLRPEGRVPPRSRTGEEGGKVTSGGAGDLAAGARTAPGVAEPERWPPRPEPKCRPPPDLSGRGQNEGRKAARPVAPAGSRPSWGGRPSGSWSCRSRPRARRGRCWSPRWDDGQRLKPETAVGVGPRAPHPRVLKRGVLRNCGNVTRTVKPTVLTISKRPARRRWGHSRCAVTAIIPAGTSRKPDLTVFVSTFFNFWTRLEWMGSQGERLPVSMTSLLKPPLPPKPRSWRRRVGVGHSGSPGAECLAPT